MYPIRVKTESTKKNPSFHLKSWPFLIQLHHSKCQNGCLSKDVSSFQYQTTVNAHHKLWMLYILHARTKSILQNGCVYWIGYIDFDKK